MNCLVNYSDSSDDEELITKTKTKSKSSETNEPSDFSISRNENQTLPLESEHVINWKFESELVNEPLKAAKQRKIELSSVDLQDEEPAEKRHKAIIDPAVSSNLKSAAKCEKICKNQLNLPSVIQSMFNDGKDSRQWKDDPLQHGNRTRSFPHVEGNWATHVFIPVKKDERLVHFVNQLLELFEPLSFEVQPEFHISLSRTVAIRHHWIDPLIDSLKKGLSSMQSCVCDLDEIKLYSNDEKTRSFLCIEVSKEDTAFSEYVSVVDKCFDDFKLPRYYDNPSFHISVAWCLGNICDSVTEGTMVKAKKLLGRFCAANPELSVVFAQNISCRSDKSDSNELTHVSNLLEKAFGI